MICWIINDHGKLAESRCPPFPPPELVLVGVCDCNMHCNTCWPAFSGYQVATIKTSQTSKELEHRHPGFHGSPVGNIPWKFTLFALSFFDSNTNLISSDENPEDCFEPLSTCKLMMVDQLLQSNWFHMPVKRKWLITFVGCNKASVLRE